MGRIVILGSAYAVADEHRENTHLAIVEEDQILLIDAPGSPIARLMRAGLSWRHINSLIITHFHPDHVSGVPLLLMDLWLLGRQDPLKVYGPAHAMERLQSMMDLYEWEKWPGFYPVEYIHVPEEAMTCFIHTPLWRVYAAPVKHFLPTLGLRIELANGSLAYSSDTEPCENVIRLAQGVNVLLHEATGEGPGHTSPEQAGHIAAQAQVGALYLIHTPPLTQPEAWVARARKAFTGPVSLARDLMQIMV
ncbi:MBL fold metallo-hydrolase [Thermanaerothrix daxensis]|uniref:MBL fold metallo-hydrolase n=1 Tax=Thermanaerothrix daxensis TaxID=869279 RepID=UPI0006C90065|nr:ribonuclease Z [Thermanaerothrix daxensis]